MSRNELDMKPEGTGNYYVDIGYGRIEKVNQRVAEYIWRLREVIKVAGVTENPRKNAERKVA